MRFLLLHLSDIHLKISDTFLLDRADKIARTLYERLPFADEVIVVVSGDITYSGLKEEFQYAEAFFKAIEQAVLSRKKLPIHYVMTPGNHDCNLTNNSTIRDTLIRDIIEKGEDAIDDEKIKLCVTPQVEFFAFRDKLSPGEVIHDDELWRCQSFGKNNAITFMAVNVSWMSQIKEKQGQLVFPISKYKDLCQPGGLNIIVLHHPLNWYVQGTYHPFKHFVKSTGDFIIAGHEHVQGAYEADDALASNCIYIDGGAINPHDKSTQSSFNNLLVDLEKMDYSCDLFSWDGENYSPKKTGKTWSDSRKLPKRYGSAFELDPKFEALIMNPGANFSHPGKSVLSLPDIFVYPNLGHLDSDRKTKKYSSSKALCDPSNVETGVIIRGQDKSGKTSLIFTLLRRYLDKKVFPIYVNCSLISKISDIELSSFIDKSVTTQYGQRFVEKYKQLNIDEKIVFLDDFDRMTLNEKNRAKVLTFFTERYKYVIITTSDIFDIRELLSPETAELVKNYKNYDLRPFGHVLRLELIKKWYNIGDFGSFSETEEIYKIDQAEKIINTVLGKNLIPAVPIYLLALLQSIESGQNNRLENSAFGHYYNYLISDAMKEIAIRPEEWDEFYNFCSQLAWEFNKLNKKELDINELRAFTVKYGQDYHEVDFSVRIKQLCSAKLITERDGYYSFTYPYIYYFFLGKYLANNLNDPTVKEQVEHYCDHLYVADYGNCILFLTHFSKEPYIISRILDLLNTLFKDKMPVKFEEDTIQFNDLLEETAKLILEDKETIENRRDINKIKDELDNENLNAPIEVVIVKKIEELDLFTKINLLFKTIDIIGQILKSYYGSIPNLQKENMLVEVFNAPLRALKDFVDYISEDKEALIKEVEGWIDKEGKKYQHGELKAKARRGIFNVVGTLNYLFLYKTSNSVASVQLTARIRQVVKDNASLSYKLIELGTKLELPGSMPIEDIKHLEMLTKKNIFARRILESLVIHHMYMFKTGIKDKQRICDLLQIEIGTQRNIDIKSKHTKRIA